MLDKSSLHIHTPGSSRSNSYRISDSAGGRTFGGRRKSMSLIPVALSKHRHFVLDLGLKKAVVGGTPPVGFSAFIPQCMESNNTAACCVHPVPCAEHAHGVCPCDMWPTAHVACNGAGGIWRWSHAPFVLALPPLLNWGWQQHAEEARWVWGCCTGLRRPPAALRRRHYTVHQQIRRTNHTKHGPRAVFYA